MQIKELYYEHLGDMAIVRANNPKHAIGLLLVQDDEGILIWFEDEEALHLFLAGIEELAGDIQNEGLQDSQKTQ